jgi:hypothetical protein
VPAPAADQASGTPLPSPRFERQSGVRKGGSAFAPAFLVGLGSFEGSPWQPRVVVMPVPGGGGQCHAALHQRGTLRFNRVRGVDRLASGPLRSNVGPSEVVFGPGIEAGTAGGLG